MSTDPLTESARGYLSVESKRRFTLVAGILGAVFFLAQLVLPMLAILLVMMPMMIGSAASIADLDEAQLWRNELWFVERTTRLNWRDPENSTILAALRHVRLTDLESAGPAVPLDVGRNDAGPALLPIGDRLWLIGADSVSYLEGGALTPLGAARRPARASSPFVYRGRPAVITLGKSSTLAILDAEGGRARWTAREFPLGLPPDTGALRALQAVEAAGRLYLFAELCTEEPEQCSLSYREESSDAWLPVVEDACSCPSWHAMAMGSRPAVVLSEGENGWEKELVVITVTEGGPRRRRIDLESKRLAWSRWRALPMEDRLFLASAGMPGSLTLAEVADGRLIRSVRKTGSFPFGPNMMLFMWIPQALPLVLSLLLALLLTGQMRRHRFPDYVIEGSRRRFASLWQRALAQLVDAVPLVAGFLAPMVWMWRVFSDPEEFFADSGPMFMLWFFGLFAAAFACSLLVLIAYSYFEGRFGKTPGKWLLGIRVLGTDLRPCGFGRAILRNLLTFVDGFFNFLVGALLVALTENWQRLGDLAARTIVVVDEKPA
jgi:uncharacterized RDD family membrane protein YckC